MTPKLSPCYKEPTMKFLRTASLVLPLLLLLDGCASTPAKRIEQNQNLFDSFPVAVQARIRGGQIDLGFRPDMVQIALGDPQSKMIRHATAGDSEIWLYIDSIRRYDRQRVDIDGLSVSGPGGLRSMGGSAWVNIEQTMPYIRTRVEFQNGIVTAFEEPALESKKEAAPAKPAP